MRSSPSAVYELQQARGCTAFAGAAAAPPLRQKLERLAFRSVLTLLRLLPREAAGALASQAAWLLLLSAGKRRRILLKNLAHAFPEKPHREIAAIARASVENTARALLDYLEASDGTAEALRARVEFTGLEHLQAARARGKGVFLLSGHFRQLEIAALAVGLLGEPIASVVRPLDNLFLEEELTRRRTRFGNRVIPKKEAARELLKAMRKNESVAILVDQNVLPQEAVFVPFFGRPAATTPSLGLLQLKTGAAVVPIFTWPLGGGRYRLGFEEPILPDDTAAPRAERVRQMTERYMRVTEAAVRREPAAWLWLHDRWRTRPPG